MVWGRVARAVAVVVIASVASSCRDPAAVPRQSRIERVDLDASVAADGSVRIEQRVTFVDDGGGLVAVPVSAGLTQLADVTLDGQPVAPASGSTEVRVAARTATVAFTLRRAVELWSDITVAGFAVHADASDASRQDPLVAFHATITLPEAAAAGDVLAYWHTSLDQKVTVAGRVVTLDGNVPAWAPSEVAIGFAPGSVHLGPDDTIFLVRDLAHRADFEARQAQREAATESLEATLDDQAALAGLVRPMFLGLVVIVLAFTVASTQRVRHANRRRRARLDDDVPGELREPPGSESPAVVALLVAKGERVDRDAVAGTLLGLVERGVIELDGITSEEFVLRLRAPRPAVSAPEAVVLDALARTAGHAQGELRGPPLWRASTPRFWTSYRRAVVAEARRAGLVQRAYKPSLFGAYAAIFVGCSWPLWLDQSLVFLLPVVTVAGTILSIPILGRVEITDMGVRRRAGWLAFQRFLSQQGEIGEVGAPGIAVWGPYLTYGTALGVARAAAEALAPADGAERVDARGDM